MFHVHTFPRVFLETSVSISVTVLFHGARVFLWGSGEQHWGMFGKTGAPERQKIAQTAQNLKPGILMSGFSDINVNICFSH